MVKRVSVREYQKPKSTERKGYKPEPQRYPEVKDETKSHCQSLPPTGHEDCKTEEHLQY